MVKVSTRQFSKDVRSVGSGVRSRLENEYRARPGTGSALHFLQCFFKDLHGSDVISEDSNWTTSGVEGSVWKFNMFF